MASPPPSLSTGYHCQEDEGHKKLKGRLKKVANLGGWVSQRYPSFARSRRECQTANASQAGKQRSIVWLCLAHIPPGEQKKIEPLLKKGAKESADRHSSRCKIGMQFHGSRKTREEICYMGGRGIEGPLKPLPSNLPGEERKKKSGENRLLSLFADIWDRVSLVIPFFLSLSGWVQARSF